MVDELIIPEELSGESLHALFDAAMFDVKMDADGDVIVKDKVRVIVSALKGGNIRFLVVFGIKEGISEEQSFALCNRINDNLVIIRAGMHDPTTMLIDWYLPVAGGITKRAVVLAFRRFTELIALIGQYDEDNLFC